MADAALALANAIMAHPWPPTLLPKRKRSTKVHVSRIVTRHCSQVNPAQVPTVLSNEEIQAIQICINQQCLLLFNFAGHKINLHMIQASQQHGFLNRGDGQAPGSMTDLKCQFVAADVDNNTKFKALHQILYTSFYRGKCWVWWHGCNGVHTSKWNHL